MTGFGRASADVAGRRLRVEVRSVNHRGLDLKIRSFEPDAYCDTQIAAAVRAVVERGAVTVSIREESAGVAGIDAERVRTVHAALESLRQELRLTEPVTLATVAAFLSAAGGLGIAGETLWEGVRPALGAALGELVEARRREGRALAADITGRSSKLTAIARALAQATTALPARFARRLEERLVALVAQPGIDPARLAQEIALMAERLDVSEEIVRLETHLAHVAELLAGDGAVGRKLDFIIQEIGRELNTIASKTQDAGVAASVIDAKAELERMREQAQNVE